MSWNDSPSSPRCRIVGGSHAIRKPGPANSARPGRRRPQQPGQGRFGLRQSGLHHRLGQRAGDLPTRGHECVLDRAEDEGEHLSAGPVRRGRLPRPLHEIQTRNRLDQQTEQWQGRYAIRAGIEATLSQNVRAHGLRRSRYRGLARTHVQHVLTAMACNVSRVADWIDTAPRTRHRATHFHTLCSATA
ncbi:transposase [Streptomyces canus]|uniref:transposase n=1 Tax=Streptomyces canus TaxID=58343 RepID=UPI0036C2E917